ncbi:unnamed protein product [Sympodiomycopsis kandeliae]
MERLLRHARSAVTQDVNDQPDGEQLDGSSSTHRKTVVHLSRRKAADSAAAEGPRIKRRKKAVKKDVIPFVERPQTVDVGISSAQNETHHAQNALESCQKATSKVSFTKEKLPTKDARSSHSITAISLKGSPDTNEAPPCEKAAKASQTSQKPSQSDITRLKIPSKVDKPTGPATTPVQPTAFYTSSSSTPKSRESSRATARQSPSRYHIHRIPHTLKLTLKKIAADDEKTRTSRVKGKDQDGQVPWQIGPETKKRKVKYDNDSNVAGIGLDARVESPSVKIEDSEPKTHATNPLILFRHPKSEEQKAMALEVVRLYALSQKGQSGSRATEDLPTESGSPSTQPYSGPLSPSSRKPYGPPPVWATSLSHLTAYTALCPQTSKYTSDSAHFKLSRGGVVRGMLLTGLTGDSKGVNADGVFTVTVPIRNKKSARREAAVKRRDSEAPLAISSDTTNTGFMAQMMARQHRQVAPQIKAEPDSDPVPSESPATSAAVSKREGESSAETLEDYSRQDLFAFGLVHAYRQRAPLYVFACGRATCQETSRSSGIKPTECVCTEHNCGGLAFLPSNFAGSPATAIGIGWAFIDSIEKCEPTSQANLTARDRLKVTFQLTKDEDHVKTKEHGGGQLGFWWRPGGYPKSRERDRLWPSKDGPESVVEEGQDRGRGRVNDHSLFRAIQCPRCNCAIPRLHWSYYCCPWCTHMTPISSIIHDVSQEDIHDLIKTTGSLPPLAGPQSARMDHGRAIFDKTHVERELKIIDGTTKCACYTLSRGHTGMPLRNGAGKVEEGNSMVKLPLIHFLANVEQRNQADRAMQMILWRDSPMVRTSLSDQCLTNGFTLSMMLDQEQMPSKTPEGILAAGIGNEVLDVNDSKYDQLSTALLDMADDVEKRVELIGTNVLFAHVRLLLGEGKRRCALLTSSDIAASGNGIAYLHLGSNAHLSVTCNTLNKNETILNALVGHGDVIFLDNRKLKSEYTIHVESAKICIGCIFT